jgi:uncharacterized Fe-S cluster-containing MiaB family protein
MWSVPYNQDHFDNWFGLGIGPESASKETLKKLEKGKSFENCKRECSKETKQNAKLQYYYYSRGIVISAEMSMHKRAELNV